MKLELKNLTRDSLIILVEAGRRLNSLDEKYQDILVAKEELITLSKLEQKCFEVKGYCCQASNCAPSKKVKYGINKLADSNLVTLAKYLSANNFEEIVEQQAIWAISDNKTTANIASAEDTILLPLRRLVSGLKGEKLPWYSFVSTTYVYASGMMETFPLWLRGKIKYDIERENYVTMYVKDEKGMPVCQIKCEWKKSGGNQEYQLNIPVKGLPKGKYTIELKSPEKQLALEEFEI